MAYLLLTGGTGLLGAYLIRDLLKAGGNLALLVRSTRKEPAQSRIESLMARWENEDGREYPRPVVLAGDLTAENLGLDAAARRWVARNCDSVMHNAASLTFQALSPNDEPWRSNLHGTRRVLDLCRETGIRKFHHVSTAYVCGLRQGRILESELDAGQTHGNDYEISKFQSELMVRQADFLDQPTVYRPGIILGDSKTGYTSTFYGFYVPLKLLSSLLTKAAGVASTQEELIAEVSYTGKRLTEVLNLSDEAGKNYIPVDWVSEVMAHIAMNPEHHGQTYHLTPDLPVNLKLTREATQAAFQKYTQLAERKTYLAAEALDFEQFFLEGMKVYAAYWRNDPIFDTTNTRRVAPHLPCPVMDSEFFMRICQFAIESNFGRRLPRPPARPKFDVHEKIQQWMSPAKPPQQERQPAPAFVGLQVDGSGGGQWELSLSDGRLISIDPGISDRCTATYHLNSRTFADLASDRTTAQQALDSGDLRIQGNGLPKSKLMQILEEAAVGSHGVHAH
jgi:nucleoside-diphosphate-sugar epimerase